MKLESLNSNKFEKVENLKCVKGGGGMMSVTMTGPEPSKRDPDTWDPDMK